VKRAKLCTIQSPLDTPPAAFTLIELLVVVAIIGILPRCSSRPWPEPRRKVGAGRAPATCIRSIWPQDVCGRLQRFPLCEFVGRDPQ